MRIETNLMKPDDMLGALKWRYAVKKFDAAKKIPADVWAPLELSLVLAPSSFGLQPWKFVVVTNQAVKERMLPASFNQRQVVDASHVVVMAARKGMHIDDVERHLARVAEVQGVHIDTLIGYRKILTGFVQTPPPHINLDVWAEKQVYIVLGQLMASAAVVGVDTCPMEGFKPAEIDEILGLSALGFTAIAMVPAGYRAADDKRAAYPKVRYKAEDVILRID